MGLRDCCQRYALLQEWTQSTDETGWMTNQFKEFVCSAERQFFLFFFSFLQRHIFRKDWLCSHLEETEKFSDSLFNCTTGKKRYTRCFLWAAWKAGNWTYYTLSFTFLIQEKRPGYIFRICLVQDSSQIPRTQFIFSKASWWPMWPLNLQTFFPLHIYSLKRCSCQQHIQQVFWIFIQHLKRTIQSNDV